MATINLRDYYPFYHHDVFVKASDDQLEKLNQWDRDDGAYYQSSYALFYVPYMAHIDHYKNIPHPSQASPWLCISLTTAI